MAATQTSPWAGVPYNPDVTQADIAPWTSPPTMGGGMPQLPAPTMPNVIEKPKLDLHANLPPVFAPTPKPNPQDEITGHLQGALETDYKKDADPWGSPDNHPGFLGKLVHGLSVATGGNTRRGWEEQGLAKQLNDVVGDEATNKYKSAETAKDTEETAEAPQKASDLHAQSGATTANLESETNLRNNPNEEWKAIPGLIGPGGEPVEIESRSGQARYGGVTGATQLKQPKPDTPEQQYIDEYQKTHQGGTIAQAEKAYTLDTQRPPQVAPIMVMVPNANGGQTAQVIRPGSEVAPGAQTMAGVNSMNTPTSSQRTAAGRAETVISMAPEVLSRIDSVAPKIGPIAGRWNEFMQGKVGGDDPDFSALRSDLLMMSSAVALAHAQGRLPENLREEFDNAINAPKQTPENLKATINTMIPWLQKVQSQGGGQQPAGQSSAPIVQHSPSTGQDRYSTDGGKTWQAGKPKQ